MDVQQLADLAEKNSSNLSSFQKDQLRLFREKGFSTADGEYYKFTKLSRFFDELDTWNSEEEKFFDPSAHQSIQTIFCVDGEFKGNETEISGLEISIDTTQDGPSDKSKLNALTHLHHSLSQKRLKIVAKKNHFHEHALRILFVSTREGVSAPTIEILGEANSKLTIIEEHLPLISNSALISETHISVENGARIEHIQIGDGQNKVQHGSTYAQIQKDGNFRSFIFHLGGRLNRRNVEINLQAPGAHGESFNLYLTSDNEHSDITTAIEHLSADSTSEQLSKGILDGNSKGIFTGKIHIHPQSQRVFSSQLNKNLLLSKKSQAHSQPQLEIFADDVKCSHGSTTGQLSDEEIFYFESRGIPHDRARTLLAHAFGMEVVMKIKNKEACEHLSTIIKKKLAEKFSLGVGQ